MKTSRWIALGVVSALAVAVAWIALAYRSALSAARQRVSTGLFRDTMIESILATPLTDVKAASADDRMSSMLDSIQPISRREKGLRNEGAVAQSLRRYELEKIAAPSLIASVEDDLFLTYANARYTAEQIPGAQFVGFARGGHLWVGHDAE